MNTNLRTVTMNDCNILLNWANDTAVREYSFNNNEITFSQIESELARQTNGLKEVTVVIRCENSLPVQELINVLQIGNKLKIKMILATKAPNG